MDYLYQFDTTIVGNIFATARFLGDLSEAITLEKDRVREYFAIVEMHETSLTPDSFAEGLSGYDTVLLPDAGIFLAPSAAAALEDYINTEPVEGTDLRFFTRIDFPDKKKGDERHTKKRESFVLYSDYAEEPVAALRNFACSIPLSGVPEGFSQDEHDQFLEGKKALDVFARFRFSPRTAGIPGERVHRVFRAAFQGCNRHGPFGNQKPCASKSWVKIPFHLTGTRSLKSFPRTRNSARSKKLIFQKVISRRYPRI